MKDPLYLGKVLSTTTDNTIYVPKVPANATVSAQSATATLTSSVFGKNVTNTGAAGSITLTLPKANTAPGLSFRVQLTVAQVVQLDPNGSESIYLGGSGVAGKYLNIAGVIGNYAEIYCDGTQYHVVSYSGVLTKEA